MIGRKKLFDRFCMLQAAYWGFFGTMPSFLVALVTERGIPGGTISFILAINMVAAFVGSLFWGKKIDEEHDNRKYFLITVCSVVAGCALIGIFSGNIPALFVIYPIHGFMAGIGASNLDSWVMLSFPERNDAAGRSRAFGTLAYAIFMLVTSQLIKWIGYPIAYVLMVVMAVIAFTLAFSLRNELTRPVGAVKETSSDANAEKHGISAGEIAALLRIRPYLILIVLVFLTGLTLQPYNNMKAVIYDSVGGDVGLLGIESIIGCIIQFPIMLYSGALRRIPIFIRMAIAIICPLIYAICVAAATTPTLIIIGTLFGFTSFGFLHPAMRELAETYVDDHLRTTANSITDMAYFHLSGMISLLYSSAVISGFGLRAISYVSIATQAAAVLILILSGGWRKK